MGRNAKNIIHYSGCSLVWSRMYTVEGYWIRSKKLRANQGVRSYSIPVDELLRLKAQYWALTGLKGVRQGSSQDKVIKIESVAGALGTFSAYHYLK